MQISVNEIRYYLTRIFAALFESSAELTRAEDDMLSLRVVPTAANAVIDHGEVYFLQRIRRFA